MRKIPFLILSGAISLALASCSDDLTIFNERPGPEATINPEMVAPGVISTEAPEFAVSFTPDGDTIFFNRTSPDRSSLVILTSSRDGSAWTQPDTAFFSGEYRDVDPFVTPDGRRIWFSSDRPRPSTDTPSFSNWYVERLADGWSEPIDPGYPVNTDSSDIFVSVAGDGTVYFSSGRDGMSRVYSVRETDRGWTSAEPIVFGEVVEAWNPLISPGGTFAIIVYSTPESGADLFLSCRLEDEWMQPMRLPVSINSDYADFAPALSAAGDRLYFTSERPGVVEAVEEGVRPPGDIYSVSFGNPCQN